MPEPVFRFLTKINLGGSTALYVVGAMTDKPIDPGELKIFAYGYLALAATIWVLRAAWRAVRRWRND